MLIMWFFAYKSLPNLLFRVLCLTGDQSHPFCTTDNKPSCVLHLLRWFIGSRGFSSLERRPEFWVLHLGARPGLGKPQTQYQPQREVSPAGIEIYVICCLYLLCFGTRTGLVGRLQSGKTDAINLNSLINPILSIFL